MSNHNVRVALVCFSVIAGMVGLTAASVPLYSLFCKVTGYGGTTQRAERAPTSKSDTEITVFFNADTATDMPWHFWPVQRSVKVHLGEEKLIFFEAENPTDHPIAGTASFNVTPFSTGPYFTKLACFCFTEQILQPGQKTQMPVSFYVDPAMLDDEDAQDERQITLSYTFFKDAAQTRKLSAEAVGPGPDRASASPAG